VEEWKVCRLTHSPQAQPQRSLFGRTFGLTQTLRFSSHRENTENQRPKLAHPRMRSRKRSLPFETRTELCN
jgi:hypothetical protein